MGAVGSKAARAGQTVREDLKKGGLEKKGAAREKDAAKKGLQREPETERGGGWVGKEGCLVFYGKEEA